jgi:ketosteroid isomerase-like protein
VNYSSKWIVSLGLLVVSSFDARVNAQPADWTPEQQAVIDAVKQGPVGIESDFDSWADGYADAWTYWRVGDPAVRPRGEHMALVREYIDAGNRPTAFDLEPVDVIVRGDVALLRLIATEELRSAEGEERVVRYASAAMLVNEDGRWKMLATNILYLD